MSAEEINTMLPRRWHRSLRFHRDPGVRLHILCEWRRTYVTSHRGGMGVCLELTIYGFGVFALFTRE